MGALETVKSLLEQEDKGGDNQNLDEDVNSLLNLKIFVDQKKRTHEMMGLLEKIRADVTNEPSGTLAEMYLLSFGEISLLVEKFHDYEKDIVNMRNKLIPLRKIIRNFEVELKKLAADLSTLQMRSSGISSDTELQKPLVEKLNLVVIDLMIPPDIVKSVMLGPIDPNWVENLRFIKEKSTFVEAVKAGNNNYADLERYKRTTAFSQLEEGLAWLSAKSIERIRDFLISQIKLLRSPTQNSSQVIQQHMLSVKEVYTFFKQHHPSLAAKLHLAYVYTMRWYYRTNFARYISALETLNVRFVDGSLALGHEMSVEGDKSGIRSWLTSSKTNNQKAALYQQQSQHRLTLTEYLLSMNKRMQIITQKETSGQPKSAIPSQIADTTPFQYWLEFVFDQWCIALIDNAVVEYLFTVEFFYEGNEKFQGLEILTSSKSEEGSGERSQTKDWYQLVFDPVHKMGYEFVKWLISHQPSIVGRSGVHSGPGNSNFRLSNATPGQVVGTCDSYGIILMIRLTQYYQSKLHNEFHVPILDDHLNSLLLLLWPHFTKIIDLHCDTMKNVIVYSTFSTKKNSLAPISLTQHFAQYLLGLMRTIDRSSKSDQNSSSVSGEPLYTSINRLRNDYESTLTKISNQQFANTPAEKEIFLYHNYFLIVNILKSETNDGRFLPIMETQIKHFETLCDAYKKI